MMKHLAFTPVLAAATLAACGPSTTPAPVVPDPVPAAAAGPADAEPEAGLAVSPPSDESPPSSEASPTPVGLELVDGKLALPEPIVFLGPDQPAFESEPLLLGAATFLEAHPDITLLRIEVHTDATGMGSANQAVSERRARAVAAWLVDHGVACGRLIPVGFGEDKPVADNRTLEGRAANRRVELIPAALRGKLVGGMPADGGGKVAGDPCAR